MKVSSGLVAAFLFLVALIVIAGGIWLYQILVPSASSDATRAEDGIFGTLFPFGNNAASGTGDAGDTTFPTPTDGPVPALRKVSPEMVAGSWFATGSQGAPTLRYTERFTGHWYETPVDSLSTTRLTNTTIPAVHDATSVNASTSIMRFLDDDESIENFVGRYVGTSTDRQLEGAFLKNYSRVAVGAGNTILGVLEASAGAILETVDADGAAPKTLVVSPITSWIPLTGGNKYFAASAPSGGVLGSVYDISNGHFNKVVGDISGLGAKPNYAGTRILLSAGNTNAVQLSVFDITSGSSTALPLATIVDKCTWVPALESVALCAVPQALPQALYPDDWLLGRVHTSDNLWFIDTLTGAATAAMELEVAAGEPIDASQLSVSNDGSYASFINRNDQTLWLATLQAR